MSKGIIQEVSGAVLIAAGAFLDVIGVPVGTYLIQAGAGLVIHGVGTMMAEASKIKSFATTERNPIAPWNVVLGCARVGGSLKFLDGDNEIDHSKEGWAKCHCKSLSPMNTKP